MSVQEGSRPPVRAVHALKTVLIGTSLGPESDEVVGAGLDLARAAGARVYLVHAAQLGLPHRPRGRRAGVDLEQKEVAACEEELRSQIQRLVTDELELLGTQVQTGVPHQVISRTAGRIGADLIVVGATGAGPLAAKLLGSTADRVMCKAPCPVLVVRNGLRVPPRRVLAPVDLSTLSGEAFFRGLKLLAQLSPGAEIQVRTVYALELPGALANGQRSSGLMLDEVEALAEEELRRFVSENQPDTPFEVEAEILYGETRTEILRDLAEYPADLVVLGTQGHSGIDRMGSVAASVCRKAPCSVLVIAPEAAREKSQPEASATWTEPGGQLEPISGFG